jgi:hypothetical protein
LVPCRFDERRFAKQRFAERRFAETVQAWWPHLGSANLRSANLPGTTFFHRRRFTIHKLLKTNLFLDAKLLLKVYRRRLSAPETRVTGLGDFSTIKSLFTLAGFLTNLKSRPNFWASLFHG